MRRFTILRGGAAARAFERRDCAADSRARLIAGAHRQRIARQARARAPDISSLAVDISLRREYAGDNTIAGPRTRPMGRGGQSTATFPLVGQPDPRFPTLSPEPFSRSLTCCIIITIRPRARANARVRSMPRALWRPRVWIWQRAAIGFIFSRRGCWERFFFFLHRGSPPRGKGNERNASGPTCRLLVAANARIFVFVQSLMFQRLT